MDDTKNNFEIKGGNSLMETMLLLVGTVFLYFAMQLWILPSFGIKT